MRSILHDCRSKPNSCPRRSMPVYPPSGRRGLFWATLRTSRIDGGCLRSPALDQSTAIQDLCTPGKASCPSGHRVPFAACSLSRLAAHAWVWPPLQACCYWTLCRLRPRKHVGHLHPSSLMADRRPSQHGLLPPPRNLPCPGPRAARRATLTQRQDARGRDASGAGASGAGAASAAKPGASSNNPYVVD